MAADNWRDLLRQDGVEDVITRAVRSVQWSWRSRPVVADDFESFAWDHAVTLAEKFDGEPDESFLRWLYAGLTGYGPMYLCNLTHGKPGSPRHQATAHTASIEQHREDWGDAGFAHAASVFGPAVSLSHRLTRDDPLAVVMRIERLERSVRQAEIRSQYNHGFVTESSPSPYCSEPLCLKPVQTAGFCRGHYSRHRKMWGRADGTSATCSEPGCQIHVASRGLCDAHFRKELRRRQAAGDMWVDEPPGECVTPECDRTAQKKGLCTRCYQRERTARQPLCVTDGCTNPSLAKGLCSSCYKNARRRAGVERDRA